jgi:uracil-xanthine permease
LLIGASLVASSGFVDWAGGSGSCAHRPTSGPYVVCPQVGGKHALPWGSAEYLGLGLLSFLTIVIVELFGSPMMRNASIVLGLVVGMIVAGPTGYVDGSSITTAKPITFLWTTTFPLKLYGPAVLPLLAVYVSLMMEAIGDTTATSEVSRVPVEGLEFDSRLQGAVLADGLNGCLASLFTMTPMSVFAQNNGVIALTRCASRTAGYWCCFWLVLYGVVGKLAGVFLSIPAPVLGGVTTFLFASVAVSGLRILSAHNLPKTRRDRFILAASLALGLGNLLVPDWAEYLFENASKAGGLPGLESAVEIVVSTPFIVCAFTGMILNTLLPNEEEGDGDDYEEDEEYYEEEGGHADGQGEKESSRHQGQLATLPRLEHSAEEGKKGSEGRSVVEDVTE